MDDSKNNQNLIVNYIESCGIDSRFKNSKFETNEDFSSTFKLESWKNVLSLVANTNNSSLV